MGEYSDMDVIGLLGSIIVLVAFVIGYLAYRKIPEYKMNSQPVTVPSTTETTPAPPLFEMHQPVIHVKTQGHYIVVGLPTQYVLEATREPAYAYLMKDGRICVRCQTEMEDGRFISGEWKKQNNEVKIVDQRVMNVPVEVERRGRGQPEHIAEEGVKSLYSE